MLRKRTFGLRKRARGIWHYRFEVGNREFSGSTGTADKREADRFAAERWRQAEIAIRTTAASLSWVMTFGQAVDRFWNEKATHYSGNYRATIWGACQWLKLEIGENTPMHDIGQLTINDAIGRRRNEGVSNATINRTVIEIASPDFPTRRQRMGSCRIA